MTFDKMRAVLAVSGVALFAAAAPVLADNDGTNLDPAATTTMTAVDALDAALALAAYGSEKGDPLVILGAAQAMKLIGAEHDGDGEVADEALAEAAKPAGTLTEKPAGDAPEEVTVASLLDEARLLARGDAGLLAQAYAIADSASKGSTTGPGRYTVTVNSQSVKRINERFYGGETATVSLIGDGDTDLDLEIYDDNGNLICTSESYDDQEYCSFNPIWTGDFTIKILNYGSVYNDAILRVN